MWFEKLQSTRQMQRIIFGILVILISVSVSCTSDRSQTLFTQIDPSISGVEFANHLTPSEDFNMYLFRNFYNGGGVAAGDVNNDGYPDLFFTGNMVSNKLYLNNGDFSFEDVTESAGLNTDGYWSTGVSMADVNGDGWTDIFIALSGPNEGAQRHNRLYINNKDGSFTESSSEWGLDHVGLSTSAHFFDADRDGDLDLLLLTNSFENLGSFAEATGDARKQTTPGAGLIFYENMGSSFIETTQQAGFYQNDIAFPLSASIGDINNDGWPDVFVANDFFERDYLFLNDGDGSFTETFEPPLVSVGSLSSMGSDLADLTNDGWLDLYVSDMRPSTPERFHAKMTYETWQEFNEQQKRGFGAQVTRNTLFQTVSLPSTLPSELPNASNTPSIILSEQARLTNSEATDWSWAVLIADYDLNGHQDILVANGIGVDLLDQDYIDQMMNPRAIAQRRADGETNIILSMLAELDSEPLSNAIFAQMSEMNFQSRSTQWGLDEPSFSSGAAWGDFDQDGDLDLVMNDVDGPARLYRNQTLEQNQKQDGERHWYAMSLQSRSKNTQAIGARVDIWMDGQMMRRDNYPQRGFQSSVESGVWFGLGTQTTIDSANIYWPDGTLQTITDPSLLTINQRVEITQPSDLSQISVSSQPTESSQTTSSLNSSHYQPNEHLSKHQIDPMFTRVEPMDIGIEFEHQAFEYNEFQRDPLLYHMRSSEGPAMCKGDINGDGLEDFYIGGARGQEGHLYIQRMDQRFERVRSQGIVRERTSEEVDCALFDANGDGLDDLYIASGGNSLVSSSTALSDRMILTEKDDNGVLLFRDTGQFYPVGSTFESTSVVAPYDFTGDGVMDLFVGTRLKPFRVGISVNGYLLEGDGQGGFRDVTSTWAPGLQELGMITHATWADLTDDGQEELIIVGEYMPVSVFGREESSTDQQPTYRNLTAELGLEGTQGWWNRIMAIDTDGDNHLELIGLNHGLNTMFRASSESPVSLWVGDITQNGLIEHILATQIDGKDIPVALKHHMEEQIPLIGQRFPTYAEYAGKSVQELFTRDELARTNRLQAFMMESMIVDWDADSNSDRLTSSPRIEKLPRWAQVSPMYAGHVHDHEGQRFLLLGGNLYNVKPQVGAYDASFGVAIDLEENQAQLDTGFQIFGEVREIISIRLGHEEDSNQSEILLVARHNDSPVVFRVEP